MDSVSSSPPIISGTAAELATLTSAEKYNLKPGHLFIVSGSGDISRWNGTSWDAVEVGGAASVLINTAAQTLQGNVYSAWFTNQAAAASSFAKVGVFNPASSGIYVAVTRIRIRNIPNAAVYYLAQHDTAFSTGATEVNRLTTGAAGSATANYEVSAGQITASGIIDQIETNNNTGAGSTIDHVFTYPYVIDEGDGLGVQNGNANVNSNMIIMEWVEIAK